MLSITLSLALQIAVASTGADGYASAYQESISEGKPLLVVVGAPWCAACEQMKHGTLTEMSRRGQLKSVAVAHLNMDNDQEIARKILRGAAIPQLILFYRTDQGWQREYRIGAQTESEVLQLIRTADARPLREGRRDGESASAGEIE